MGTSVEAITKSC